MIQVIDLLLVMGIIACGYIIKLLWQQRSLAVAAKQSAPQSPGTAKVGVTADAMTPSSRKPQLHILWGSQTGTAEQFANELAEEADQYGFEGISVDLENFDGEQLSELQAAVFLLATYGDGDPTDNAATFYEWLMSSDREEDSLSKLKFAVFGLGNKQYEHFCLIGKKADKQLQHLGAQRLCERGDGDDDSVMEDDFRAWKEKFWAAISDEFGNHRSKEKRLFVPQVAVQTYQPDSPEIAGKLRKGLQTVQHFSESTKHTAHIATVSDNRELRKDNAEGHTFHLEIDISGCPGLVYETADNLGVHPQNDAALAARFIARLGLNPETVVALSGKKAANVPALCTVSDLFLWFLDFTQTPRLPHMEIFAQYASDPAEAQRLLAFMQSPEKEHYNKDKHSFLEIFERFPSCQMPLEAFVEICPRLTPRFYTISSSAKLFPQTIHLTVVVSQHTFDDGRVYKGIASHYMHALKPGQQMAIFVRASSFRLPRPDRPVVMVGPGTGVAPFRAFLQERHWQTFDQRLRLAPAILFFGCRNREKDFIYEEELTTAESKDLCALHVAFSRDPRPRPRPAAAAAVSEENKEEDLPVADAPAKLYVQHLIEEHGAAVWDAVGKPGALGSFFVCGGAAMGKAVRDALIRVVHKHGKLSMPLATKYVQRMAEKKTYVAELWS